MCIRDRIREHQLEKDTRREQYEKRRRERDPNYQPRDEDFDQPPVREYDAQTDYYALLSVDEFASEAEIRRAFKKRAMLYHPDRLHGKSPAEKELFEQKFKAVSLAHEILGDHATRRQYDRERRDKQKTSVAWGGDKKPKQTPAGVPDVHKEDKGPRRGANVVLSVEVTAAELEQGCTKAVEHARKVFGPGGLSTHTRRFSVQVYRGDSNNSRRVFPGEADEGHGMIPGDLVCVLKVAADSRFFCLDHNLLVDVDAVGEPRLAGQQRILFEVVHLPGRECSVVLYALAIGPGLHKGCLEQIAPGLGLPLEDAPCPERGALVARFWHKCEPCTVEYRAAVAPVLCMGSGVSEEAVCVQLSALCLQHVAARRCFHGPRGPAVAVVTVGGRELGAAAMMAADAAQQALSGLKQQRRHVQVQAGWEEGLLDEERVGVLTAEVLVVEHTHHLWPELLEAYWGGALLVLVGLALHSAAVHMPWLRCGRLASDAASRAGILEMHPRAAAVLCVDGQCMHKPSSIKEPASPGQAAPKTMPEEAQESPQAEAAVGGGGFCQMYGCDCHGYEEFPFGDEEDECTCGHSKQRHPSL
eukprot:TRINITY_DN13954_c0_g1_i1.p1 TRINITY_DN13954_c0_g1~~TRINITY_DN13954_c0_g1_i1.p1  ORF type:complete len:585 (+),score=181.90 TRINITY_DN13954_c0_g1_i1:96-1850(+)